MCPNWRACMKYLGLIICYIFNRTRSIERRYTNSNLVYYQQIYCIRNEYIFRPFFWKYGLYATVFSLTRFSVLISIRRVMPFMTESKEDPYNFQRSNVTFKNIDKVHIFHMNLFFMLLPSSIGFAYEGQ